MLYVVGLNYHQSALEVRESFAPGPKADALCLALRELPLIDEVFILSTCNRCEIYFLLSASAAHRLPDLDTHQHPMLDTIFFQIKKTWLEVLQLEPQIQAALFALWGRFAIEHLAKVSVGLEAMMLGEPQILGQVKAAFRDSQVLGTAGAGMKRILDPVFELVKEIRTETPIGRSPVSFASATFRLAQQIFSDVGSCNLLFIGAGEMIELVCRQFYHQQARRIRVANRSLDRIAPLVSEFGVEPLPLDTLHHEIQQTDIVISCTGSHESLVSKEMVKNALQTRRMKPLFLADLAVPRDICPSVATLENAFLYTVDDIHGVLQGSKQKRLLAAEDAHALIKSGVDDIIAQQRVHYFSPVIQQYRHEAEQIRANALAHARRLLIKGEDPFQVLEALSQNLTKRLIHKPTCGLRTVASQGQAGSVDIVKELLGLKEH